MVLNKSIYYGRFDGFQFPVVPKAPRSLRVSSHRESSEGSKTSAFDLLAAVADKLLQESESSTSTIGQERKEQISILKQEEAEVKLKHLRSQHVDQGSSVPEFTNLTRKLEPPMNKSPQSDDDSGLEHVSDVTTYDFWKKVGNNVKFEPSEGENVDKLEGDAPSHGNLCDFNLVNNIAEIKTEAVEKESGDLTFRCVNTCVLNKSCSRYRGNAKRCITDDDENSFRCNHHGTKTRAYRSQSHGGCSRIRKMLSSRYRKVTPKRDSELTNTTSGGVKPLHQNRKNIEGGSKRRKLFHHSSNTAYFQEASNESMFKSYEKSGNGDRTHPHAASNKAAGVTSSVISHEGSFQCKDSHVKFSIKSFKVPELYVEIPETATVGSLKRTVMETVTAILGGELDVGILVEGKKVREDNRTLQQMGLSQNSDLETLGFTLEPGFPQASPSPIQKEPPLSLPDDTNQQPSRSAASPIMDVGFLNFSLDPPPATSLDYNHVDKNQEIIPLQTEVVTEDSKAIVPVPDVKAEPLSIVPVDDHNPTKRCERRTRRPFSVSEVEALVEAVETLGTGRWRDVKLRAFDDANHRTYVDLKDKWKTLVHTASISPQQRRGAAVPQDLLDRVLAAHAYWSQHQHQVNLKQQRKHYQSQAVGILKAS